MLALRGLCEGFARGLVSLHPPPILGRKSFETKSNYSHTCAAPWQAQSLLLLTRYPGGPSMIFSSFATRCSLTLSKSQGPLFPLFPLHTKSSPVTPLFPLLTQKQASTPPSKNVGAPTFLIFPHIFRSFCGPVFVVSGFQTGAVLRGLRRVIFSVAPVPAAAPHCSVERCSSAACT
jgi:hypothetical protein